MAPSPITTITADSRKASVVSRRKASVSGAGRAFWKGEKRSNEKTSSTAACCTGKLLSKLQT